MLRGADSRRRATLPASLRVTLAGLRTHKLRLVLTAMAIVLGVGFVTGTLTYADTARAALYQRFAGSAAGVDADVRATGGDHRLPASALSTVESVAGVRAAAGRASESLPILAPNGRPITNFGLAGKGVNVIGDAGLRPYTIHSGHLPAGDGQVAVDRNTAARYHFRIGGPVTVVDHHQHRHRLVLTGTVEMATGTGGRDGSTAVLTEHALGRYSGHPGYRQIVAHAAPGVSERQLTARVRAAIGSPHVEVISGSALRVELADDAISAVSVFSTALLVFALVALVVAAFVIYNTFTILLAQRRRELALLRCVGASRRQVFGAVLGESTLVGLAASTLGVLFGFALAYGMAAALGALGLALPATHALVVTPRTVLVGVAAGLLVTVAAALLPAVAATRIAPMAALRAPAEHTGRRRTAARIVAAALLGLLGGALTVLGVTAKPVGTGENTTGMLLVVGGGLVVFLGLVVLAPLYLAPVTAAVGYLPGRLLGPAARLAGRNARRNPGRVAATSTPLMIGVALMTIFSVALATVRASADAELSHSFRADYLLTGVQAEPGSGVPAAAVTALRNRPELAGITAQHSARSTVAGGRTTVSALEPGADLRPKTTAGSLTRLHAGTAALHQAVAAKLGRHVGDTVSIGGHRYRIVALYAGSMVGSALLSWPDFRAGYGTHPAQSVYVRARAGIPAADSRAAVDAALRPYPLVNVSSMADTKQQLSSSIDQLLGVFAALLGISVLIAVFGIANTLSLSVFERSRESALLRALGLTRGQLRGMLLTEAVLIAVVGALVGIAFGIGYGIAAARAALTGFAGGVQLPVGQILLYLALAALAGLVAAVLPARRAARTSLTVAMAEE
ncbi:ABC transporter substrate-binding protein [Actinocatenispora thailandica]|uniref:ABC transporter substrate-binding protein n=1 Tax=Actinocatenispora thailandica TaxID=227318 RepID=A0A7R7DWT3_9ACTN|nr:FtsX family ABC transporter permease [Actinocatenispora thailandica]BCJ39328.1 ABC transporter substrate-binding protein [Actinocatenispora thailandica]